MLHDLAIMFCAVLCAIGVLLLVVSTYRLTAALDGWPGKRLPLDALRRSRDLALLALAALLFSLALVFRIGLGPMPFAITGGIAFFALLNCIGHLAVLKLETKA